jgi:hypothetical protein
MNEETMRKKRYRLLVYPRFQLGLTAASALMTIFMFTSVWLQIEESFKNLRKMGVDASLPPGNQYFQFLSFSKDHILIQIGFAFVVCFILTSLVMLFISQRLAGPIIRLRAFLNAIIHDEVPPKDLAFRKGDYFSDLPEIVNEAFVVLNKKNKNDAA